MKEIYNVSNTIKMGTGKVRRWSRMTTFKPALTFLALLMVCLFGVNVEAWALDEYVNVSYFNGYTKFSGSGNSGTGLNQVSDGTFSATQNLVTFSINNVSKYDNKRLCFGDQSYNTTKNVTFSWATTSTNYSVSVSRIDAKIRAYSIPKYASSAWFNGHSANGYSTNSTGTGGAGDIYATSNLGGSSTILYLKNAETKAGAFGAPKNLEYTLHDIKFTYQVTYKQYLYGFEAIGGVNNSTYGSVTVSGKDTVRNNFSPLTKATKQVSFTASVKDSKKYKFLGWYTDAACTTGFVSAANPYTPTLENKQAGTFVTKTLYAKFGEKGQPAVTCNIADEYEIGHSEIDLQELWTRDEGNGAVTYSIVPNSFSPSGNNNEGATAPALRDSRYLSFGQAGTLTLKMEIAADGDEYLSRTETKNITINKISNSLKCAWDGGSAGNTWTYDVNFDAQKGVLFSSTTANPKPIEVTRTAGEDIVKYNASAHTIKALNKEGYAEWTVSQDENYMYAPASETFRVSVETTDPSTPCYVLANQSSDKTVWHGETTHEYKWNDEKAAGTISFQIYYVAGSIDPGYKVQQYVDKDGDGSWNWEDVTNQRVDHGTSWSWKSDELDHSAKGVRIWGSGSLNNHVKNVSVTRYGRIDTEDENGAAITSITMPENVKGGVTKTKSFYIDYSTCADYIKVVSSNPRVKFTASNDTVYEFLSGHYNAHKEIEVAYISPVNEGENLNETITIYTPYEYKLFVITGHTKESLDTHLVYKGNASYTTDATNIAATDLFEVRDENEDVVDGAVITLGTGTTDFVAIANDNKSIASLCGNSNSGTTGNVTASYAGDGSTYEAATNNGLSQNFTINRLDDEVSIDTHGHSVLVVGDTLDLTGWGSALSNSAITFTSGNLSYFKIEEGKIIALAKGDANLIATSAGNCVYNSGSTNTSIKVRNTNDPCSTLSLNKTGKITIKDGKSTTYNDITEGVYDKLEFKVWKQTLAASSNKTWVTLIGESNAELYSYEISADSLNNSENNAKTVVVNLANYQTLKKVQFTGNGSLYSQYFKDVKITRQAYLRANAGSGTLAANANVSMPKVKACEESSKDITISYSDVSRIQLSHTNPAFTYEVYKGGNLIEDFDNDCGGYGEFTLRCKCTPTAKDTYSDVVTLSASGKTQVINLSFTADKPDRTIVWGIPLTNSVMATQSVDLGAVVNTSCQNNAGTVSYEWSSDSVAAATIVGNRITFHKYATVTVKAYSDATDEYNKADTVSKVWTVGKVGTQMSKLPTITSTITYGDNKSVVAYANDWVAVSSLNDKDTVSGSIAYVGPDNFTAAGATNLTFNFTPNNISAYEVRQFTVPVTVQRATTTASANDIVLTYGDTPESKTLTTAGDALEGTWSWNDDRSDDMLNASEDAYALNVIFTPKNTNYAPYATTVNVTVAQATTTATANAIELTYGDTPESKTLTTAGDALEGTWSWNDDRSDDVLNASEDAYALNVIFTPKNTNYASYATTVNVKVAKATTTATANAIELTYGETPVSKTITTASASMEGTWLWNDDRSDDALNASEDAYALNVIFTPKNTNYASYATTVNVTVAKATTTLSWADGMATNLAYNGTATYTATSASDGAITYSVIDGEDYAHFDANVLTVDEPNHKITIQASQAAGTNYLAPTAITMEVTIAAAPLNEFTNATGNGKWDDPENWTSVPTGSDPTVIVSGALEIKNENVTVGNLTIESTGSVAVITGGTLTVKGTSENRSAYGDIHVMDDGALALGNSAHLEVRHFTLDAKLAGENNLKVKEAAASGQVSNEEKMNVNGNVYFQLSFDPLGYITYGWYNFTVPFPVDINGGISRVNSNNDKVMVSGQDFIVMEADELNRANGGKGWRRLNSGVLQPGKLYTITFDDEINQNTFQFAWNGQGSISNGESFATQCAPGSVETLRGWNGLGNGMLCHGHLDADYKKQLYDHGTNTYVTVAGEKTFAVGTAFFIQVPETISSVSWDEAAETVDRPMYAPKRVAREIEEFSLSLMDEEAEKVHDMLFFSASEDATEKYVIGKDLVKMGTPTEATVAQMWATKGGNKLCDIEAALINDQASTPLSIYAPKAGSYWFAIDEAPEDAMLYLTYNDEIIWDLTISPYLFDLSKGTTTGYGLRIEAKKAPAITTGVEQSEVSGQTMRKVIIDNRVYIVTPDGKMYDIVGKGIKF